VLGIRNPVRNMGAVLGRAIDIALEEKDPQRKLARRRRREEDARRASEVAAAVSPRPDEVAAQNQDAAPRPDEVAAPRLVEARAMRPERRPEREEARPRAKSRYIPSATCERVFERAGYRCEYTGPDGTRCNSRTGLEIEHTRPFAIHGSHDERYLRVYCRGHNRLAAEMVYGERFIERKIEESRRRQASRGGAPPWEAG
jgi:hypothetical protein